MKSMHRVNALLIGLFISLQLCGSSFFNPGKAILNRDKYTPQWQSIVWFTGFSILTYLGWRTMATGKMPATSNLNANHSTSFITTPTITQLRSSGSDTRKTLDEYPPNKKNPDLCQEKTPPTTIKETKWALSTRVSAEMDTPKTLGPDLPDVKTYMVQIMLFDNSIFSNFEAIIGNKTTIDDIVEAIVSSEPRLKGKIFLRNNKPMTMESIIENIKEYEESVALQKAALEAGLFIQENALTGTDKIPSIVFKSSIQQTPIKTKQEEQEECLQQLLRGSGSLLCLTFFDAVME